MTTTLTIAALGVAPLADLLGLVTLPASGYLVATGLGLVPLVAVQSARALRDRQR